MKTRLSKKSEIKNCKFEELNAKELKEINGGLKYTIYYNPNGTVDYIISL